MRVQHCACGEVCFASHCMAASGVVLHWLRSGQKAHSNSGGPLQVQYQEKMSAAGKMPSQARRAGGSSDREKEIAGRIGRALNPLLPDGLHQRVQASALLIHSGERGAIDLAGPPALLMAAWPSTAANLAAQGLLTPVHWIARSALRSSAQMEERIWRGWASMQPQRPSPALACCGRGLLLQCVWPS